MKLFDDCLLACDVDGTLLEDGKINPKSIERISFFIENGGHFSLATGRSAGAMNMVLDALGAIAPCVTANGSVLYDFSENRILFEKCLPKNDYAIARRVLEESPATGIEIHCGKDVFVLNDTGEARDHREYEWFDAPVITYEKACRYNWNKCIYLFEDARDAAIVKELTGRLENTSDFVDTSASIDGRVRNYYEQLPTGISKASALKKLTELLNIKKGRFYAIGDYYNDIEMLKAADISAAPLDSPDDVKSATDVITVPCRDGAVADFIDYLARIREDEHNNERFIKA